MIQSMTGYGAADYVENGASYLLEIRSVNHRYLKLLIRMPEPWQFAEAAVERILRARLSRGSVTCALRVRGEDGFGLCPINLAALQGYVDQFSRVLVPEAVQATVDLSALTLLPGVMNTPELDDEVRGHQQAVVERLATRAVDELIKMRQEEGLAMRESLVECCDIIRDRLDEVAARAPKVIEEYHERLRTRVSMLMQAGGFELEAEGLMREISIYAERCDITEEVIRLTSHLDQFRELCDRKELAGRTLDFLAQELLREANTIASKSNDAPITHGIVEVKGLIDRMKEQVQNVE